MLRPTKSDSVSKIRSLHPKTALYQNERLSNQYMQVTGLSWGLHIF